MQKGILYGIYTHNDLMRMKIKNVLRGLLSSIAEFTYEYHTSNMRKDGTKIDVGGKYDSIVIFANSITDYDGVSKDVLFEAEKLRSLGILVFVGASGCSNWQKLNVLPATEVLRILKQGKSWLIYHHSIYSKDSPAVIQASMGRCIIRYHNITPPEYYKYCAAIAHMCKMGLLQLDRYVRTYDVAGYIATSKYTKEGLVSIGASASDVRICPPFISISNESTISKDIIEEFSKWDINVLFVGRVVSNKGYEHLLRVVNEYKELYDDKVCLHVVGSLNANMGLYYHKLDKIMNDLNVTENVIWWGMLPEEDLDQVYRLSTVFVCASEHEGFCMPIIEAQLRGVPVVGFATSVIGETIGNQSYLVEPFNYHKMADLIHELARNQKTRQSIIDAGNENCKTYVQAAVGNLFYQDLSEIGLRLDNIREQ